MEFKDIKLPDEFYDALIEGMKLPAGGNAYDFGNFRIYLQAN